jgi:predicted dehydrogenase
LTPIRNFVDALKDNDTLRCDGRYGVLLAELMEAIYRSAETGSPVDVVHSMKALKRRKL